MEEIHLAATTLSPPDPAELAGELFHGQRDCWLFEPQIAAYLPLLGDSGWANYRKRVAQAFDNAWPMDAAEDDARDYGLWSMMQAVLVIDGTVAERINVAARDLSSPVRYLRLAELCSEAGRREEAMDWLDRELALGTEDRSGALSAQKARLLIDAGKAEEGFDIIWAWFSTDPGDYALRTVRNIWDDMPATTRPIWSACEAEALSLLAARMKDPAVPDWQRRNSLEAMIRLHLHRGDPLSAWRIGRDQSLSGDLLSRIADGLGPVEPDIAADILRRQIEPLVAATSGGAYDTAGRKLETLAGLMEEGAFAEYITDLRTRHRRKRNFIQRIEGIG